MARFSGWRKVGLNLQRFKVGPDCSVLICIQGNWTRLPHHQREQLNIVADALQDLDRIETEREQEARP